MVYYYLKTTGPFEKDPKLPRIRSILSKHRFKSSLELVLLQGVPSQLSRFIRVYRLREEAHLNLPTRKALKGYCQIDSY